MTTRKRTATIAALLGGVLAVAAPVLAQPPAGAGGGNPHASGATGNPHDAGSTGNPHEGSGASGFTSPPGNSGNAGTGSRGSGGGSANGGSGGNPSGAGGNPDRPSGKTTICHATGSETNPYVVITPSNNSLDAHGAHQNEEDVIPAQNGSCPSGTTPTEEPPKEEPPKVQPPPSPKDGVRVSPATEEVRSVLASGDEDNPAAADEAVAGKRDGDQLPFTGLGIGAMLITAVVLIAGGWIVRFRGFLTIGA